eukprot:CAMPEP_0180458328 /NCGR_PEP_ID=MMETSP1036_2-20121128/22288_1 /TAXON_ID=632150 /ORGANISM="Azadinium spinosum, Strain 3D9" /LENGTH=488 /DNA_ID=CAMNT_0022464977 /DNA_START=98 /DNA_END=1564 /DNA_ORIENTATION=-
MWLLLGTCATAAFGTSCPGGIGDVEACESISNTDTEVVESMKVGLLQTKLTHTLERNTPVHRSPARQVLDNHDDVMYTGNMTIGGQQIRGILDTGSFELVIFGMQCSTCGIASAYDHTHSSNYHEGHESKELAYGSGACRADDGFDNVAILDLKAENQSFWLTNYCEMPLLESAPFNAIVGLGPPGEPVYVARSYLQDDFYMAKKTGMLPASIARDKHELDVAKSKPDLLAQFSVKTFSTCFGREAGSAGYHIWNDVVPTSSSGMVTAHVPGKLFWSAEVKSASFHDSNSHSTTPIACKNGCAAIVDTGTTLLGFDTASYTDIYDHLNEMNMDCSDLSVFPNLHMKVGDGELILPPEAYIGELFGFSSDIGHLMHIDRPSPFRNASRLHETGHVVMCELLIMDMGTMMTEFGPEILIGMPIFREYYVTFDLGSGRDDRTIFFSPANDNCEPMSDAQSLERSSAGIVSKRPMKIDASKIRVPKSFGGQL